MTTVSRQKVPFRAKLNLGHRRPEINPYIGLHETFGPPVITAEQAVGCRGRWDEVFGRAAPLHLEVGAGNGFFLAGMAQKHPERSFVGIEIRYKRVVLCARKIQAAGLKNARIARYDAWWLDDLFEAGSVSGLYVNHPDPWKRDRQANKRLMGEYFAAFAAWVLKPGATLRLKSDHAPNLDQLAAGAEGLPLRLVDRSSDVRQRLPWPEEDDVTTNYQSKFDKRELPVHALLLERTDDALPPALAAQFGPGRQTLGEE